MPSVINVTKGTVVAERVKVAASYWSRLWGLLGRKGLPAGEGLLLRPSSSIHTLFMRFPIDVVFLDRDHRVVKVVSALKPYRFALGGRGAWAALELPAGSAEKAQVSPDDVLVISDED